MISTVRISASTLAQAMPKLAVTAACEERAGLGMAASSMARRSRSAMAIPADRSVARQNHEKLLAAETERVIGALAQLALHDCGDALQAIIARLMAESVVEHLEMIDIEQLHGKLFARRLLA